NVYVKGTSRSTYLLLKINLAISDDRKWVMAFISIALASCSVNFSSAIHFSSLDFISVCSSCAVNGICFITVCIFVPLLANDLMLKRNQDISDNIKWLMAFISIALASCSVNFSSAIHFSSQDFISVSSSGAVNGICCITVCIALPISALDRRWAYCITRGRGEHGAGKGI